MDWVIILGGTFLFLMYMAYGYKIRQIHNQRVLKKELHKRQIVDEHSTKVMRFKEVVRGLDSEIFEVTEKDYICIETSSLQQYNRLIKDKKTILKKAYSKDELNRLKMLIEQAKKNEDIVDELRIWAKNIPDTSTEVILATGLSITEFRNIEDKIISSLFPVDDPVWEIEIVYDSPGGRNHYEESIFVDLGEMENFIENEISKTHETDEKKIERSKMSSSLRYNILKRDGFRCQLCGRTASDGVTLEVDHILPVSKGGKTEESNLRTLCKDCNRGKRDKIE